MHKLHTIITLLLHFCFLDEAFSRNGPECNADTFHSPYVKVRRKKNGADIDSLEKTGFVDLSRYVHVILCVNGPAVILSNYEEVLNGTTNISIFSNGTLKVYNHKCMLINKIASAEVERLKQAHTPPRITLDIPVVGIRAVGIQLVGETGDYTKSTPAWFHRQNYGHDIRKDKIITDGSFAIIGIENTRFCLKVNREFNVVLISKAKTDNEVCIWTIKSIDDHYERYHDIFRSNRTFMDYEWQVCPPPGVTTTTTTTPPTPTGVIVDPITIATISPFSIINPHGTRPPKVTSTESTTTLDPLDPSVTLGPKPKPEIAVEYTVELDICQEFPRFDPSGCVTAPADRSCDLMKQVLLIEPKYLEEELKWKSDILDLISEIFGKICEPFPPDMAYTINRVLEYYLVLAHEKDTDVPPKFRRHQTQTWKIIINDLQICNRKIVKPIWFDWRYPDLAEDVGFDFRRRRKRSPSYKNNQRIQRSTRLNWWDKNSEYRIKSHKSYGKSNSAKKSKRYKPFNLKKQKFHGSPMEFLEQSSLPIAHSMKRSPVTVPDITNATVLPDASNLTVPNAGNLTVTNAANSTTVPVNATSKALPVGATGTFRVPLLPVGSEGGTPLIQESIHEIQTKSYNFLSYPVDVHHANHKDTSIRTNIFYYDDNAEVEYDLNVAIDIAWKIWATVAGYCNQHYEAREAETFPRFYNTYYEEFMEPVEEDWKYPFDNEILMAILSEYNSEENAKWLDTCLEASYIDSNTKTYRPPRPLLVQGEKASLMEANAFLEIPLEQYSRFHNVSSASMANFGRSFKRKGRTTTFKRSKKHRGRGK